MEKIRIRDGKKSDPRYTFRVRITAFLGELRGLSPNFHIRVFVSDLYIPRIGPHTGCERY
jgi:hypothetical protein